MIFREVICPYCKHVNRFKIGTEAYQPPEVVTCDVDEGGCDKDFVIKVYVDVDIKTLKIEAEED
jgi:hypothetical protein